MLFEAEYNHEGEGSCASCVATKKIPREERRDNTPVIHYGTIASGNQVFQDGGSRLDEQRSMPGHPRDL